MIGQAIKGCKAPCLNEFVNLRLFVFPDYEKLHCKGKPYWFSG